MKPILIPLLAATLTLSACTTVIPGRTVPARMTELNLHPMQGRTSIVIASGSESQAVDFLTIAKDSVYWVDAMNENVRAIALTDLRSFTVRDRFKGMLYGEIGGLALGLVAGIPLESSQDQMALGLAGMLGGIALGAIIGVPHTYEFTW
jgi:hypothetical protein